ncbi:hypothetical protein B0T21DRAFT_409226 [Apiosordaria backusii]|uniref:Uncharacterized protein n=1 Tax=Apiosordaria backusii TaxID=314023 RepID=A0AA40EN67_9PEZI|nr:hypothetical protein B0T21DRAFT_409226 [Apiosordaria backusii]
MSSHGATPAAHLATLADDESSIALRWLDMIPPGPEDANYSSIHAAEKSYYLKVVEEPTNAMVRHIADPLNLISVMGPARSGKSTLMNLLAGWQQLDWPTALRPWRSTNLEFFEWTVEISEIMWGTPIITEIKPFKLNSTSYSAQNKEMVVDVGNIDTVTTTTTDSFTWAVTAGGEYSYSWGNKATVGEDTFKASFGVKFDTTHMNSVQTTYTTSTLAHMTLPAGRANVIHSWQKDLKEKVQETK